jgi:acyl carrier protein
MHSEQTVSKLEAIVNQCGDYPRNPISLNDLLRNGEKLELDSLGLFELSALVEENFGKRLSDEELPQAVHLPFLIEWVEN